MPAAAACGARTPSDAASHPCRHHGGASEGRSRPGSRWPEEKDGDVPAALRSSYHAPSAGANQKFFSRDKHGVRTRGAAAARVAPRPPISSLPG